MYSNDLVIFQCGHIFHQICLESNGLVCSDDVFERLDLLFLSQFAAQHQLPHMQRSKLESAEHGFWKQVTRKVDRVASS